MYKSANKDKYNTEAELRQDGAVVVYENMN